MDYIVGRGLKAPTFLETPELEKEFLEMNQLLQDTDIFHEMSSDVKKEKATLKCFQEAHEERQKTQREALKASQKILSKTVEEKEAETSKKSSDEDARTQLSPQTLFLMMELFNQALENPSVETMDTGNNPMETAPADTTTSEPPVVEEADDPETSEPRSLTKASETPKENPKSTQVTTETNLGRKLQADIPMPDSPTSPTPDDTDPPEWYRELTPEAEKRYIQEEDMEGLMYYWNQMGSVAVSPSRPSGIFPPVPEHDSILRYQAPARECRSCGKTHQNLAGNCAVDVFLTHERKRNAKGFSTLPPPLRLHVLKDRYARYMKHGAELDTPNRDDPDPECAALKNSLWNPNPYGGYARHVLFALIDEAYHLPHNFTALRFREFRMWKAETASRYQRPIPTVNSRRRLRERRLHPYALHPVKWNFSNTQ